MRITPAVKAILIINLVFYVLTYWVAPIVPLNGHSDWFLNFNALYPIGSENFAVYQYVTYMFMHGGFMHLFFNMWSLMIFGNAVEEQVGSKVFWCYYLACGMGAALFNQLLAFFGIIMPSLLVGASGAVYGIMAAAAFFFPNARLFIIPIPFPIKLKYLVIGYTVIEMYLGVTSVDGVAHFAHLGGVIVGLIFLFILKAVLKKRSQNNSYWTSTSSSNYNRNSNYSKDSGVMSKIKDFFVGKPKPKMRVTKVGEYNAADHAYNQRKREDSEEIDRILDKIRKDGYQSLTEEEKARLFDASKKMRGE